MQTMPLTLKAVTKSRIEPSSRAAENKMSAVARGDGHSEIGFDDEPIFNAKKP